MSTNLLTPTPPTLESAIAATKASSEASVARFNSDLTNTYLQNVFAPWADSVRAGVTDNSHPPQPPRAFRLSAPVPPGFQWPEVGDQPVCMIPPIPDNAAPPQKPQHGRLDIINLPPGDTRKAGEVVTGAMLIKEGANAAEVDNPASLFLRVDQVTPWATAKFYARLT